MHTQKQPEQTNIIANGDSIPAASGGNVPAAVSLSPMDALKPLLNANGELELTTLEMGPRVQAFIEFRDKCNFNLPLWDTAILSQFPPGVSLVPVLMVPAKGDAWRGDDAAKMKLKPGHVEPSADFILKLGNIAGVYLDKIHEGINQDTKLWSVRYNAKIQLPNGEWLTIQDEGKDSDAFNNDGSPKAHVAEATRKKAKRNVVKNLLGIPTSMPEAEFDRAWVILKPVFRPGDPETNRIIADRRRMAEQSSASLYNGQTIDVPAQKVNEEGQLNAEGAKGLIRAATSLAALAEVEKALPAVAMTGEERRIIGALLITKKDDLGQAGEVKL